MRPSKPTPCPQHRYSRWPGRLSNRKGTGQSREEADHRMDYDETVRGLEVAERKQRLVILTAEAQGKQVKVMQDHTAAVNLRCQCSQILIIAAQHCPDQAWHGRARQIALQGQLLQHRVRDIRTRRRHQPHWAAASQRPVIVRAQRSVPVTSSFLESFKKT